MHSLMKLACRVFMLLIWPVQFTGMWGTPDKPRKYREGGPVPFWIETCICDGRLWDGITFYQDAECYFDRKDGRHHVWPVAGDVPELLDVRDAGDSDIYIKGAPTVFHTGGPRKRRPRKVENPSAWALSGLAPAFSPTNRIPRPASQG